MLVGVAVVFGDRVGFGARSLVVNRAGVTILGHRVRIMVRFRFRYRTG